MQKITETSNKADPGALKRERRMIELRANLERARAQYAEVKQSGTHDHGAEQRTLDLQAWIERIESELAALAAQMEVTQ